MILTVDIGNTTISVGCIEEKIIFSEHLSANIGKTPLEYAVSFRSVLELHSIAPQTIEGGIISSVVPSETSVVKEALEKLLRRKVMVVGPGIKTGLSISIDDPAQLGANLAAGAVAGIKEYGAPLIIFDMGTATAVSVIDKNKNYIGGMILTGVTTALDALVEKTSLLQSVAVEPPKKLIGSNTADCIKSGAVYGTAAAVDGIIDRLEEELGCVAVIAATGVMAESVCPYCRHDIIVDKELLIKGLSEIYRKNRKK